MGQTSVEVSEMYESGMSISEISKKVKLDKDFICSILSSDITDYDHDYPEDDPYNEYILFAQEK